MKRPPTIILIAILLLAACAPAPAEDTATTQAPSPLPLSSTSTLTPSPTSTAFTPSPSSKPTITAVPRKTATPTSTFNTAQIAYLTHYPVTHQAYWKGVTATLKSRGAVCDDGFEIEVPENAIRDTNGSWTVFTCSPFSEDWTQRYTEVRRHDGSQSWRISHQGFNWSQRIGALLDVAIWDDISEIVYLSSGTYPGGSGFYAPSIFNTERALYRLDLSNGKLTSLLAEIINEGGYSVFYSYTFSPDKNYLAYNNPMDSSVIQLQNLKTEEIKTIPIGREYIEAGRFVWTLDSQKVVFAGAIDGWLEEEAGISLFSYSVQNGKLKTILYNNLNNYYPPKYWEIDELWTSESELYLGAISIQENNFSPNYWQINISTGSITPFPTVTPRP